MHNTLPIKLTADSSAIPNLLELVQRAFAFMESLINPPSSMQSLTVEKIKSACSFGEVWTIGELPDACVFLKVRGDYLYISKLAVNEIMRGKGLARKLVDLAEHRAKSMGLSGLELETRVELTENHDTFQCLGFVKSGEGSHDGFVRTTFIVMRKAIELG